MKEYMSEFLCTVFFYLKFVYIGITFEQCFGVRAIIESHWCPSSKLFHNYGSIKTILAENRPNHLDKPVPEHYTTNPTFKDPKMAFETLWEKEKVLITSIFSFSHNVFYHIMDKFIIWATVSLSSVNAFNLD